VLLASGNPQEPGEEQGPDETGEPPPEPPPLAPEPLPPPAAPPLDALVCAAEEEDGCAEPEGVALAEDVAEPIAGVLVVSPGSRLPADGSGAARMHDLLPFGQAVTVCTPVPE
jgi:hypothetical protein